MISNAERNQSCKRLDFSGRLCTPLGQTAKLYPDFGNKDKDVLTPGIIPSNLKDESIRS